MRVLALEWWVLGGEVNECMLLCLCVRVLAKPGE